MKKVLFLIVMLAVTALSSAQTVVFHENFDPPSNADSVTASGTANFTVNTRLYNSSPQCDSLEVPSVAPLNSICYLTSQPFSTIGSSNVTLQFSHICKIEIFDTAKIEVSVDGGATWVKLTTQYINPGDANWSTQGYRFSANTYSTLWLIGTPTAKPQQSWWRNEVFDISALAGNKPDVRVRFVLKDGDGDGASQNMGWYLDDINVSGANSELFPPKITMKAPIIQDTVYNTGPFNIYAYIKDASGIDTAYIQYQLNGGASQYIPMLWVSDSTYLGTIPSYTYNNRIDYKVYAFDNSLSHNTAVGSNYWFFIKKLNFISLGNGTSSSYTYGPIYRLSNSSTTDFSRYFYLFPESELTAAGLPNGASITKVEWYKTDTNRTLGNATFNIYMKNSVQTVLASTPWATLITGATQVYSSTAQAIPGVAGWLPFSLTPYQYTGQGLEIGTDWDISAVAGNPTNGPFNFQYTSGYPVYNIRGTGTSAPATLGTTSTYRPNIRIYYTVPDVTEDAGVKSILTPTGNLLTGLNYPVTLNIKNYAVDTLKKVTIAWTLDGVTQTPYNWTGVLLQDVVSGTINIGNANVSTVGTHIVKAWTELPNDSTDQNHSNDTASISFYACNAALSGTYTVGGAGADFATLADVATGLNNCGIGGPTTFKINSGTYTEQLALTQISGASAVNTVTFMPNTGATVVITSASTTSTIKLNGTDYIIFDGSNNGTTTRDMTISNTGTTSGSAAIWMASAGAGMGCTNVVIKNCIINAGANTSGIYGICIGGATMATTGADNDNILIQNNSISKAYVGIWAQGNAAANPGVLDNLQIIGNSLGSSTVADYLGHDGIIVANATASNIQGNTIFNIITTNNTLVGLTLSTGFTSSTVTKNNINNIRYTGTSGYGGRGMYVNTANANSNLIIANNFISEIFGDGWTSFSGSSPVGIYVDGTTGGLNIYYNSVYLSGVLTRNSATLTTAVLFNTATITGVDLRNNIFSNDIINTTNASAKNFAIYSTAPATSFTSINNNDYYVSGVQGVLGFLGADQTTLSAWQTATSQDGNSVNVNPTFTSTTDLHTFFAGLDGKATPIAGITDDIDGEVRNATTPDIGADEFTPLADDLGITSVIAPVGGCGLGSAENVTIQLKNFGGTTVTTADVYYSINNGTPVHEVFTGSIAPNTTYIYTFTQQANLSAIANYTFTFFVSLTGDENGLNDTVSGYTISNGWDFAAADYTMGFEPGEDVSNWSVVNTDASSYKWELSYSSSTYSHTGTYSARFYNSSTNTGEDWMFSRCFYLEAGKTYSISFWYRSYSATSPQTITLKYGTAASIAGMTTTLTTLTAIVNTVHTQSVSQFTVPASGIYYFGWSGVAGLANYAYIDDINIKVIPDQEVALEKIYTPNSGCGLTASENVTIRIKNTGSDTISGNLTAYYAINNTVPVSSAVSNQILPGDTLLYTFPVAADMSVTTQDSTFNFKVWVNLLNDPIPSNDTLTKSVESLHVPSAPVITNDTVTYGQAATLQAISTDNVYWYINDTTTAYFHQGNSYITAPLFDTVTYFVNAMSGTLTQHVGPVDNSIGSGGTVSSSYYLIFDVLAPSMRLQGVYVYPGAAGNVVLYIANSAGTVLTTITYPVTTTNVKTYIPINYDIPAGTSYRIGYNSASGGVSLYRNSAGATYPYTLPGIVSITGNSFTGYPEYYYYCYDWAIGAAGCTGPRVPVIAYVELPANEISVKKIISPVDACTFGTEIVKATFGNSGTDTINTPFTAGYFISGNPVPVTETVNTPILPGDSIDYTFTTPANMPVLSGDSVYSVKVFASIAGDPYHVNDSLSKDVTLSFTPPSPLGVDDTVAYGSSAVLTAVSPYPISWYEVPSGGSAIDTGATYMTPLLYSNTTYYAETKSGIQSQYVGPYDYSIGTSSTYANTTYYLYFDVLDPNGITIQSIDIFPSTAPGAAFTIQLLNNAGGLLQEYSGVTTVASGARETVPVNFAVPYGTDFRIKFGQSSGFWRNTNGASYPYVIPNVISIDGNSFSGYPEYYYFFYNWQVGGATSGCASLRTPVTAHVTGQPNVDAGLVAFTEPDTLISLGYHDVKVILKNYGLDTLHSVTINYSVNGITQTPFNWTGALPTNTADTVTIANHNFVFTPYPGLNDLVAWTENPNSVADPTTANDTINTVINAHDPLNGVYYILTATPDFNSFSEAVTVLNAWGVSGPVTMVADAGTYNEHISLTAIPGASDTSTVTFRSINNINTEVSLEYAATGTADNYVVQLDGADYIRFKNMTIKSTSTTTYGRVVELKNAASNNIFEGNILESIETTSTSASPVYCNTVDCDFNTFIGNDLLNGYYGAYFYGTSANRYQGLKFINNNISNYYYYGLYTYYTDSVQVIGNKLTTSSVSSTNYSVYTYYPDNNARVEKNKVEYNGTGSFYGIYLYNGNTSATIPNWVANNFVSNTGSSGTAYGIYLSGNNYVNVYYNSTNITAGSTTSRGLYQTGGTSNVNIMNNNLANNAGGYSFYISTPAAVNACDYNNLYTTGAALAYWGADRATLALLQAASGKDVHSKTLQPLYLSVSDLHTYQFGLYASAYPVAGITDDIDGETRDAIAPCIGADEFKLPKLDAGVSMINTPSNPAVGGLQPVKVTIQNFGMDTIHNVAITYELDGVVAGTYNWSGTLLSNDTIMNVNVGNITLLAGNSIIRAWTSMPNFTMDTNNFNDTTSTSVIVCGGPLVGTYTVGGSNPDYFTFNDAVTAMNYCGIGGPVVFNVANGTYTERLNIGLIAGMSATNTVTFQSASGDNTDVILQAAGTGTADNYVIQLNGAIYTSFKNMTINLSPLQPTEEWLLL